MFKNAVVWFEIYVQDIERAKRFYESVFEMTMAKLGDTTLEMWGFPPTATDKTGASGSIVRMEGYPSGGNSTLVYFSCADCAVQGARVVAAGGRIQRDKMSIGPYGFIVLAVDTEGNLIGLHSLA